MRWTEIHVVIDNGTMIASVIQQTHHLWANNGIDGEVRAKQYDVVCLYVGIYEIQLVVWMVFIKKVFRIVVLVEEC